jgi:predicted transglutaminase-like cysteine proteinase
MQLFGRAHALRAAVLACVVTWLGPATGLMAGTPDSAAITEPASIPAEPFGLSASRIYAGHLHQKWLGLARKLDDEAVQLALCHGNRDGCASEAALQFLAIVDSARARDGRARLGEINRAINLSIRAMSDFAQYGQIDIWSSPLVTFYRGAGDCEDYAIAKFVALREAGVPTDDVRIVIMRDTIRGEDHAVAAARLDGHWLILDNRRMAMIEDSTVRNYRPLFVIDQSGIMRYADPPLLAAAQGHEVAPTAMLRLAAEPGQISPWN